LGEEKSHEEQEAIKAEFNRRCDEKHIAGSLVIENGNITRSLYDRSSWADLLILRMLFPPPFRILKKLRSGLRTLIRLSRVPLLIYPPGAKTEIHRLLLAYGGGPRADEALFVATYLAAKRGLRLTVVTVDRGRPGDKKLAKRAKDYLADHKVDQVDYVFRKGEPARIILQTADSSHSDLILMGGYEGGLLPQLFFGSTVDWVLWATHKPVLICQ
jgi:nucleotide-binding universal stress UspA family protein